MADGSDDPKPPMDGPGVFSAHALHRSNEINFKMLQVLGKIEELLRDFRDEFIAFRKMRENGGGGGHH